MTKRAVALTLAFVSIVWVLHAGILDRIKKAWQNGDFEKTEKLVLKSLEKDTLNPGARFYYSLLFLDSSFVRRDIDSASFFIERSILDYESASPEMLEDFKQSGLVPDMLYAQKDRVGNEAFKRAAQLMVIPAFEDFMLRFEYSDMVPTARAIRDSLAFDDAKNDHTWEAYEAYYKKYPDSEYMPEAKERYQRLIFNDLTKDDKLESYVDFLKNYPDTPYRKLAESIIFERSTKRNTPDDYYDFVRNYPNSHLRKKAIDIAYYLEGAQSISQRVHHWHPGIDSLRDIHELNYASIFPVFEKEKFGFMSTDGSSMIGPAFGGISVDYLCGNVVANWLEVINGGNRMAVTRKGEVILDGFSELKSVSNAVKLVRFGNSGHLYHSSGFKILDLVVEDARELSNSWIAFKHEYNWGIVTPNGVKILAPDYDDILEVGKFCILQKDEQYAISTISDLLANADTKLKFEFEDYELIQDTLIQVFNGEIEAVIDQWLQYIVQPAAHEIHINGSFWYVKANGGYHMVKEEESEVLNQTFQSVEVNDGWLAFKKPEGWLLVSRKSESALVINELDSVKLLNDHFAFTVKGQKAAVITHNGKRFEDKKNYSIKSLNSDPKFGNTAFLIFTGSRDKLVFDSRNEEIFTVTCEEITLLTDSLFRVKCGGKVGLMSARTKKEVLPSKYEALDLQDDLAFLLRNGKIGCFDLQNGALIPAEYSARIKKVGKYYQVSKEGLYGLVDEHNKQLFPAEYDEIKEWNDTSIWVRTNAHWQLISLQGDVFLGKIQTLNMWMKLGDEQLAMVLGEGGTGLYSNKRGEILAAQYNEIINVGSENEPVFFAEQHLKTAAFFVVTYFNLGGEAIKSQAFRPEEYDQIYCDQ
ncbi:MAG: WG repeat-containing protein [Marinoscillum sp.]